MSVPTRSTHTLPSPSSDEREHSERLIAHIREVITHAGGVIDFERFMDLALYAPGLGYYSAGSQKFGRAGDFVTAPEMSPLFARCLARQCTAILRQTGGDVLEVGAGSGRLAADMLRALADEGSLPERYLILELSADLRARQQQHLRDTVPDLCTRVQWIEALPSHLRGVVVANEVLDAMSVARFRIMKDGVHAMGVAWEGDRFVWRDVPADAHTQARVATLSLDEGYMSEINARAEAWTQSIAHILEAGVLLLIDYGFPRTEYYHPDRRGGTLMCHYRHHAHDDPLVLVGLQDITAHVDFTAIAEAGYAAGLRVLGYASQAAFLLSLGLTEFGAEETDPRALLARNQQIKLLTLPTEMGELFKVIALGRGVEPPLQGFTLQDRRARL